MSSLVSNVESRPPVTYPAWLRLLYWVPLPANSKHKHAATASWECYLVMLSLCLGSYVFICLDRHNPYLEQTQLTILSFIHFPCAHFLHNICFQTISLLSINCTDKKLFHTRFISFLHILQPHFLPSISCFYILLLPQLSTCHWIGNICKHFSNRVRDYSVYRLSCITLVLEEASHPL